MFFHLKILYSRRFFTLILVSIVMILFEMLHVILRLHSAESLPLRPSRVRGAQLPPEMQLSKFIRNLTKKHPTWSEESPIASWEGVQCSSPRQIHTVRWCNMALSGVLNWDYLPDSLVLFDISSDSVTTYPNMLAGEVPFSRFPPSTEVIFLHRNCFAGQLEFFTFPRNLRSLNLARNQFTGTGSFQELPPTLDHLNISHNFGRKDLHQRI